MLTLIMESFVQSTSSHFIKDFIIITFIYFLITSQLICYTPPFYTEQVMLRNTNTIHSQIP